MSGPFNVSKEDAWEPLNSFLAPQAPAGPPVRKASQAGDKPTLVDRTVRRVKREGQAARKQARRALYTKDRPSTPPEQRRHMLGGAMVGGQAATAGAFGVAAGKELARGNAVRSADAREAAATAAGRLPAKGRTKATRSAYESAAARKTAAQAAVERAASGGKVKRVSRAAADTVRATSSRGKARAAVAAGLAGTAALTARRANAARSYDGGWYGR
jgi:hypothetical protein